MGIFDKQNQFSNEQALTATAASTNQIDLGPPSWAGNANGAGRRIPISGSLAETFVSAGSSTLVITVRSSAAADMSSPVLHQASAAIPKASLVAGARLDDLIGALEIPENALRYVDVHYTVAVANFSAGKITLGVEADRQTNK